LGPGESERLKLNEPLTAALEQALNEEIMEGHCNLLPEAALPRMSSVQRFRDASMADRLLAHASPAGAVLIAGNGHVRRDRAVPWYLERRGVPGDAIVALAVMEVEPGDTDVDHYVPTGPDGRAAVDYVWFTPRAQRADQCEELKNRFQSRR
jgi:uncharacterized iron-regulated protein